MLYGNFDQRKSKLKWIDLDDSHSQLVTDDSAQDIIVELEYNIQIPTKCHWSSFNHITREHKNVGNCYSYYDYLGEREQSKDAVVRDLIRECETIIKNTKGLKKKLQDIPNER